VSMVSIMILDNDPVRMTALATAFDAHGDLKIASAVSKRETAFKQLAIELKARLKPGDEVASYREYYQDLPVYLEQRITVVDWAGELTFGAGREDTKAWMTDGDTFWKRWQGPATMYVLTRIEDYEILKRSMPHLTLFPVTQDQRNILLSNREVTP